MNRKSYLSLLTFILMTLSFSLGCGGGGSSTTVQASPVVTATSGTPQSAVVTTAFSAQLVATVTTGGTPTSGVVVTFTAPSSGASGTFAGGVNTATTNANGVATSAVFTANATAGAYTVRASVPGAAASASFSLTNTAGAAASIAVSSGSGQSAAVGTAFAAPLVVTVLDSSSNPVSGATVTFTAPSSGASGSFAGGVNTATTNASGVATSAVFTANGTTGGPYTVNATVTGVATPASFSLTNTAAVEIITATSGSGQSAAINTAFAAQLVATVTTGGSPNSGVLVTFTAPASGASGTFAGGVNTATTNGSGVATSAVFTANGTTGAYTVTASAAGAATPASFSLTNTSAVAASITATSGTPQSATFNSAFSAPLVVTVLDASSNPVSGAIVTFTAPSTGASGSFAGGVNTATTDSNGVATSAVFTANATGGAYTVSASVAGVATPAAFSLTNTGVNYAFYLSGLESINGGSSGGGNYYALAGAVTVDGNGTVMAGEQDYNDGFGLTSHDNITGGNLTVDPSTGQGTLALLTNASLGVSGTETLGVQFVNTRHALIVQFDGSATSSGSMDFQTLSSSIADGNYAFTLSGVDPGYLSIVVGGVFTVSNSGTTLSGKYDVDDQGDPSTPTLGLSLSGTLSSADSFGRGTITNTQIATTFAYYIVGPKAIRIIDIDDSAFGVPSDSAIGSAFSQGAGTFSNASLGASVFGIQSSSQGSNTVYAAAGQFTVPTSGTFQGVGDNDELANGIPDTRSPFSGTYSIASDGYGSLTMTGSLGDISILGIYMTDPTLNLNDPNNTVSGLGGGLLADLDTVVNGTGVVVPQTDTASASFSGNYAFGAQDFFQTSSNSGEFDFVGRGSVTALTLSGTGLVSDPFSSFSGTPPSGGVASGVSFAGTAVADLTYTGRYTLPLQITTGVCSFQTLSIAIYQVDGSQLLWMDEDNGSTFLGFVEKQGSLTGLPAIKKKAPKKARSQVAPNC